MNSRSKVGGEQNCCSKLAAENANVRKHPSNFEQSKSIIFQGRTSNQKTNSSIYHLAQGLKTSNNDKTNLKIISGSSDDSWCSKGIFNEAKSVSKTNLRNSSNVKKYSEGDAISKRFGDATDKSKTVGDGFSPGKKPASDVVTVSQSHKQNATIPGPKLRTTVESYQLLLEKRKEEIYNLQQRTHFQNQEIESLKQNLHDYQRQISELQKTLADTEREMAQLKQTLGIEREKLAGVKNPGLKLQMDDLSKRLKCEEVTGKELRIMNEDLKKCLSTERDTNRCLNEEMELKQAHIDELMAKLKSRSKQLQEFKKQSLDVDAFAQEKQHLEEQLEKAQAENERLKVRVEEQEVELREKNHSIEELRQKVEQLRSAGEKVEQAAKVLVDKQNQLLALNAKLVEVNASLGTEKAHVEKTMTKLESTHKRVLLDLKTMLVTFRKQLVAKFKESEDLRRKLRTKETILTELLDRGFSAPPRRRGSQLSTVSRRKERGRSPRSSRCYKKKIKRRTFVPLRHLTRVNPRTSESSLRTLSNFTTPKSPQSPYGCSDRGDNSSHDGFESLYATSNHRSPKRHETTSTHRRLCVYSTLKPHKECSNFLSQANNRKICNTHTPFLNISPALIHLGLSQIRQMERMQRSSHRNFHNRNQTDKKIDLGIDLRKFLPETSDLVDHSLCKKKITESGIEPKSSGKTSKPFSKLTHDNDGTVFELVSRICAHLYDSVSKMVTENSV